LTINGVAIYAAGTAIATGQQLTGSGVATQINLYSSQTGVSASLSGTGALVLTAADGLGCAAMLFALLLTLAFTGNSPRPLIADAGHYEAPAVRSEARPSTSIDSIRRERPGRRALGAGQAAVIRIVSGT